MRRQLHRPPKYALHPGYVYPLDGGYRWIGYWPLIRSYKLHPRDCIEWNDEAPETYIDRRERDYIHLYALSNGMYLETRLALEAETKRIQNELKDLLLRSAIQPDG